MAGCYRSQIQFTHVITFSEMRFIHSIIQAPLLTDRIASRFIIQIQAPAPVYYKSWQHFDPISSFDFMPFTSAAAA
jgi:hypothetical protein